MRDFRSLTRYGAASPGDDRQPSNSTALGRGGGSADRYVTIQNDLLLDLERTQHDLSAYVNGYVRLRAQAAACQIVIVTLDRAKAERQRLSDDFYLQQLSIHVTTLKPLAGALKEMLAIDDMPSERVVAHDKSLTEGLAAMKIVRNPSQDADPVAAANVVSNSVSAMRELVESISEDCVGRASELLSDMRVAMERIKTVEATLDLLEQAPPPRPKAMADTAFQAGVSNVGAVPDMAAVNVTNTTQGQQQRTTQR